MIDEFHRNGYCKVGNVFSKEFIQELQAECLVLAKAIPADLRKKYQSQGSLIQLLDYPYFSKVIAHNKLFDCFAEFGFEDTVFSSGYLISKPAKSPPLFWHQDWWGWDHPSSYTSTIAQFFVMIYLQKTDRENGCLRVIPGSHRKEFELLSSLEAHTNELSAYNDPSSIQFQNLDEEVGVEVNVGDVVFGDARLLHGAYGNNSDRERGLLTLWYHPNFGDLPGAIRSSIWQLHNGVVDGVDTPISEGGIATWPEAEKQLLSGIIPRVGKEKPLGWNRTPEWQNRT